MFDKLEVLAVLESANIQMSNFLLKRLLALLQFCCLKIVGPGLGLIPPLVWRRISWKVDVEFG